MRQLILAFLILVTSVFNIYGNGILIQYDRPEYINLAQYLANDMTLISENRPDFYFLGQARLPQKLDFCDNLIQITQLDNQVRLVYQDSRLANQKTYIYDSKIPQRQISIKWVEEVFGKTVPREKKKVLLFYSLSSREDMIKIKTLIQNKEALSLNDQLKLLESLFSQDSFLLKLGADRFSQFAGQAKKISGQKIQAEVVYKAKLIEIVLLNQIKNGLKSSANYEIVEIASQKEKEDLWARSSGQYDSLIYVSFETGASPYKIKVFTLDQANPKQPRIMEQEIELNDKLNEMIGMLAGKVIAESQKNYLFIPLTASFIKKDIPQNNVMEQKYNSLKDEKEIQKQKEKQESNLFSLYGGGVWNKSHEYALPGMMEKEFKNSFGLSVMLEAQFFENISFLAKANFFPFRKTVPIYDQYSNNLGKVEIENSFEFLTGVNAFFRFQKLKIGGTLQPGINFSRIGISPSNPTLWTGRDIEARYFTGLKVLSGVFIEYDYWVPIYLEIYYQVGKTEYLNANGWGANLLIKFFSF